MINPLSVERINTVAPYYTLHTTCVKDEDGIPNFAALIIRNDNPFIVEIVSEFVEMAKALQQKP